MCHAGVVDYNTVVWLPNALVLTALLGAIAVWRWRAKGALVGVRWVGVALLPLALYGLGLFRLVWSVSLAVSRFGSGFAFRPSVWFGLILGVIAVAMIVVPPRLDRRLGGSSNPPAKAVSGRKTPARGKQSAGVDDEMSEIQDILKKHGLG